MRQLADSSGSTIDGQTHYYDAYGNFLQGWSLTPNTDLRYAGEMWDSDIGMYYNRARWYDPANGRFNRTDPFSGNYQDPQSLHKYIYGHDNPINNIDPTGKYTGSIVESMVVMGISIQEVAISTYVSWMAYNTIKNIDEAFNRTKAQREIELFIQTAPSTFTQQQFEELETRIKQKTRSRKKKLLYLHL